jgi:hypothetical protein
MPQEQLKKAREKKKAAKMRELNKKRINELTQGTAGIVRVKEIDFEVIHKDVMKKGSTLLKVTKQNLPQ